MGSKKTNTTMMYSSDPVIAYQQAADRARRENEKRYQQMMQIYDKVIAQYQPGGAFGQGALALYEQGKSSALSTGMQSLVDAGLANTTVAAGLPIKYEQEVGQPFRLQLEDMRMSRLAEAQAQKAGAIERRTDAYPDPALMASLVQKSATQSAVPSFSANRNYSGFLANMGSQPARTITPATASVSQEPQRRYGTMPGAGGMFSGSSFLDSYSPMSAQTPAYSRGGEMSDEEIAKWARKNMARAAEQSGYFHYVPSPGSQYKRS